MTVDINAISMLAFFWKWIMFQVKLGYYLTLQRFEVALFTYILALLCKCFIDNSILFDEEMSVYRYFFNLSIKYFNKLR